MDDSLLERYLRKKRSSGDVYVKRNTLTTLDHVKQIIPKQKIADVRLPKTNTIFEKQQKPHISERMKMNAFHKYNADGLDKAYADDKGLFLDRDTKTLFIAGTKHDTIAHAMEDIGDDVMLLPTNLTEYSTRYKDADELIKSLPDGSINKLVGHSLSSSVIHTLNEFHTLNGKKPFKTVTYGSPFMNSGMDKHPNNFRHKNDPVSMFDHSGVTFGNAGLFNVLQNHDYHHYQVPADTTPITPVKPGFVSSKPLFNGGQIKPFSDNGAIGYSTNYTNPFTQIKQS